jgi:hypothetical protein
MQDENLTQGDDDGGLSSEVWAAKKMSAMDYVDLGGVGKELALADRQPQQAQGRGWLLPVLLPLHFAEAFIFEGSCMHSGLSAPGLGGHMYTAHGPMETSVRAAETNVGPRRMREQIGITTEYASVEDVNFFWEEHAYGSDDGED